MNDHPAQRAAKIIGTGSFLPETVVSCSDLDRLTGKPAGWTACKTGVLERRFANGILQSEMAAHAARAALADAGLAFDQIDLLIAACGIPEQPIPCNAARILAALAPHSQGVGGYDLNATCLSFPLAFEAASQAIALGKRKTVLIVSSELASKGLNYEEAESAALMGDGAAAIIVHASEKRRVLGTAFETFPQGVRFAEIRAGGSRLHASDQPSLADSLFEMDGKALFRLVANDLKRIVEKALAEAHLQLPDIDIVIPHHASLPAIELLRKKLGISKEQLFHELDRYGNTIAASIPIALDSSIKKERLRRGNKVLLVGTAAGVSIGACVFEY